MILIVWLLKKNSRLAINDVNILEVIADEQFIMEWFMFMIVPKNKENLYMLIKN